MMLSKFVTIISVCEHNHLLFFFIRSLFKGQAGPRYCGTGANSNNLQFLSTKNYILIIFQSDQDFAGRGFRAQATLAR